MANTSQITVDLRGMEGAIKGLQGIAARLGHDGKILMRGVGNIALRASARAFRAQADPESGRAWKPTGGLALQTRPGGGSGGKTLSDTAGLAQSIQTSLNVSLDQAVIGTNKRYGKIHQTGGTIRPVNAKALAIPVTREARRAGSPRRFPRKLFILKGHAPGSAMLAEAMGGGKTGKVRVQYLLRSSVKIEARPFIGVNESDRQEMANFAVGFMQRAIEGGLI